MDRFSDTETEILGNIDRRTGKYPDLEELFYGDGPRAYFYDALWQRVRDIRKAERERNTPEPIRRAPAQYNDVQHEVYNPAEEAEIARMIDEGEM